MHIKLVQDLGVDNVVAEHLSETYGDRAFEVGRNATMTGLRWPLVGKRLHPEYPYIEAEVRCMFELFRFGHIYLAFFKKLKFLKLQFFCRFDTQLNGNMQQLPLIF
jgi:hypothetical protein